jgi:hypothetical protein
MVSTVMFSSFAVVAVLMVRAAMANYVFQREYMKYVDREKGLRRVFFPMVWVNKAYFDDKPELLRKQQLTMKRFLLLGIAFLAWIGLGMLLTAVFPRH